MGRSPEADAGPVAGVQRQIHGRRKGHRLRPGRQRLLAERLPEVQFRLPETGRLDPRTLFSPPPTRLWLEIGFGGGEHLAAQAARHREVGLLGCDPYLGGVARLLALAETAGLTNLRLLIDDARLLLAALPDASLERVFVLFPDPWPKARHHKRRLIGSWTAAELERVIAPGGELRLATDDMGYGRAMLLCLRARPGFAWCAARPDDWRRRPADWPATRYEEKARAAGRPRLYLRFRRHRWNGEKSLKSRPERLI